MANAVVASKQVLNTSFLSTDTVKNIAISSVDTTKSIIVASFITSAGTNDPEDLFITFRFTSATNVRVERGGTPNQVLVDVHLEVLEFSSGVSVQHVFHNPGGSASSNVAISSVDTSKTFVMGSTQTTETAWDNTVDAVYNLTSSTNVNIEFAAAPPADCDIALQVVTIDTASVQKIVHDSNAAVTSENIVISAVDPDKTFLTASRRRLAGSTDLPGNEIKAIVLTGSTTINMSSYATQSNSRRYVIYIVEIDTPGFTCQTGNITVGAGTDFVDQAISSVIQTKSIVGNFTGSPYSIMGIDDPVTDARYHAYTWEFINDTTIRCERESSATADNTAVVYQALAFQDSPSVSSSANFFPFFQPFQMQRKA